MTKAALPLFGPAFTPAEAAELSGSTLTASRWLRNNTWARSPDSPADHLTVMEVVLLAAAHAFGLKGQAMQEMFVLLRRTKMPEGRFLITLRDRNRPLVPLVRTGTPAELPADMHGLLVYDATPILMATGVLDRPIEREPARSPAPATEAARRPTPRGRQDPLFGPRQDELF